MLCFENDGVAEANGFGGRIKLFDEGTSDVFANVSNNGFAEWAVTALDGVSHPDAAILILSDIDYKQSTFCIDAHDLSALERACFNIGARLSSKNLTVS